MKQILLQGQYYPYADTLDEHRLYLALYGCSVINEGQGIVIDEVGNTLEVDYATELDNDSTIEEMWQKMAALGLSRD